MRGRYGGTATAFRLPFSAWGCNFLMRPANEGKNTFFAFPKDNKNALRLSTPSVGVSHSREVNACREKGKRRCYWEEWKEKGQEDD